MSDKQGRVPAIILPSGVKIEASEDNTLASDIVVTVIEKKITRNYNNAVFDDHSNTSELLYEISAFRNPSSSLENKTYVSTLEKPFKITIPNAMVSEGVTFMGIKESETDPWRYFNILDSDEVLANISGLRASGASKTEYTFNIFKLGVQLVLVNFNGNSDNKLPETFVSSLIASSTASIHVKDGKYIESIPIKGIMKGVKLDSIKPIDLRARITYRSDSEDEAPIKVNDVKVTQGRNEDKTVPGYSYRYSFDVENVVSSSLMSTNGEFEFTLNLEGVETKSFPSGFLIEFYNKIDGANILPYIYAEFYKINQIEVVSLSLKSEDDNIVDEEDNLFCLNPVFTVTSDYKFSDTDKKKIASAISVSNVDSEKVTKTWNDQTLTISFAESLQPNMEYAISMSEVSDIENTSIIPFELFNFKTANAQIDGYAVIINKGRGVADVSGDGLHAEGSTVIASCTMQDGYVFDKWTDSEGNEVPGTFTMPADNVIITANAKAITYEIVYNLGEGSPEGNNPTRYTAETETFSIVNPSKYGYTFAGWTGTDLDSASTTLSIVQGSVGNKEFTANYTPISYSITCNPNGGILAGDNPDSYDITSATITLNEPTKEGYSFIGWTGTGLDSASTTLSIVQGSTGNREYTANWSKNSYYLSINKTSGINTVTGDG
ncbi:MAG: InlB B-repeat-containing protein, partial [Candidatus Riflebacteria bacterium]|nr:InlB B-repeat-containing protein [Candidatus Riflebacteria bacterium]